MATTRNFNDLINDYLPNKMLFEEIKKRDYLLTKVAKDEDYKGGKLKIPFLAATGSSISFGSLTDSNDVANETPVVGTITSYSEVWGTMKFDHGDILDHSGKVPESTFLNILPDQLDRFLQTYKETISVALLSGPHFAAVTDATNAATGVLVVDRVERFQIGQKFSLDDADSSPTSVYVTKVNLNTNSITVSATRGGTAADVSAYSVAQSARCYHPGVDSTGATTFTSLISQLLPASEGGVATLYGKTKADYSNLQAIAVDGSAITATNIIEKLFDAYVECRRKGRGNANEFVMSYKNWGSVMKAMQTEKGAFVVVGQPKRAQYGWSEITIASTQSGEVLTVVGVQEMTDSEILIMDWSTVKLYSNGGVRKRKSPDGKVYYEVRATTGYSYLVDVSFFGALACLRPSSNGVIYDVAY